MSRSARALAALQAVLVVVGLVVLIVGLRGLWIDRARTVPIDVAKWAIGSALAVDVVLMPLAALVTHAVVPGHRWGPPVAWGLASSVVAVLYSAPFLSGEGRNPSVPSLLNRNYSAGLLAALVVIWALAGVWWWRSTRLTPR